MPPPNYSSPYTDKKFYLPQSLKNRPTMSHQWHDRLLEKDLLFVIPNLWCAQQVELTIFALLIACGSHMGIIKTFTKSSLFSIVCQLLPSSTNEPPALNALNFSWSTQCSFLWANLSSSSRWTRSQTQFFAWFRVLLGTHQRRIFESFLLPSKMFWPASHDFDYFDHFIN